MRTLTGGLIGALAALWLGVPANAASTVTYQYTGTVLDCPVTGIPPCGVILFPGDSLSGPYVVDAAAAAPGGSFSYTDVLSFATMVGDFFAVTSDNSSLIDGEVFLDDKGGVIGGSLVILATALPDAPPTQVSLDLTAGTWMAEVILPDMDPIFISSGTGKLTLVPIPGALFLFAPALALLAAVRRRPTDA